MLSESFFYFYKGAMHRWFILLFFLLTIPSYSGETDLVPVLYKGRYRPLGSVLSKERDLNVLPAIPLKKSTLQQTAGEWVPIPSLTDKMQSLYSQKELEAIQSAWKSQDYSRLADTLLTAYHTIEGTPYKKAYGKTLYYPTLLRLKLEFFLYRVPLSWITLCFYLIALLLYFWKKRGFYLFFCIAFVFHTLALVLRSYLLMRPPVSNMSETLLYVPWVASLTALFFRKHRAPIFAASLTAAILLLFVPPHHDFENVQAVLNSQYWLTIHVLLVVGSYGILFLSGILGHYYLLKRSPSAQIEKTLLQTMYLGSGMLIIGTILGGIWAAQSWGRFWDWDPKEAWAFISAGTYLIGIHAYTFKKIAGKGLALWAIIGLMSITFTWYGVNYILKTGLHSYGFGNGGEIFYYSYLLGEIAFLTFTLLFKNAFTKNGRLKKKGKSSKPSDFLQDIK